MDVCVNDGGIIMRKIDEKMKRKPKRRQSNGKSSPNRLRTAKRKYIDQWEIK